jgi:hypothetical protein
MKYNSIIATTLLHVTHNSYLQSCLVNSIFIEILRLIY